MTLLSFPDFLLGLPAGPAGAGGNGTSFSNIFLSSVAAGIPDVGQRASAADFFALDDWKVTRTLTINLGVRVEVDGQQSEVDGRDIEFLPSILRCTPSRWLYEPSHLRICSARQLFRHCPRGISACQFNPAESPRPNASGTPHRVRVAAIFFATSGSSRRIWHLREPHQLRGEWLITGS